MTPPRPAEQSLTAELRSSALLLGLLMVVVLAGIGLGLISGLAS